MRWDKKFLIPNAKSDSFEDIFPDLDIEFEEYHQQENTTMMNRIFKILTTDVKVLFKAYLDDAAQLYGYY